MEKGTLSQFKREKINADFVEKAEKILYISGSIRDNYFLRSLL